MGTFKDGDYLTHPLIDEPERTFVDETKTEVASQICMHPECTNRATKLAIDMSDNTSAWYCDTHYAEHLAEE